MENKRDIETLVATVSVPKPGDFPIGSAASRAAARAMLNQMPLPPIIFWNVTIKKNQDFFDEAEIEGETIRLLPGESQEEFRNRALAIAQRTKTKPVFILMSYSQDKAELERRRRFPDSIEFGPR